MAAGLTVDWQGYPPLTLRVACGGEEHVVRWEAGEVTASAHDVEGEALLEALGGDPCPCLAIVEVWRRASPRDDVWLLVYEAVQYAKLGLAEDTVASGPFVDVPSGGTGGLGRRRRAALGLTTRVLPPAWQVVVLARQLSDADGWDRVPDDDREIVLDMIAKLVDIELRRCAPRPDPLPEVCVDPWAVADVVGDRILLPPWWVGRVYARQASVLDGRLVLDLRPHPDGDGRFLALLLDVLPRGRLRVARAIAVLTAEGWSLAPDGLAGATGARPR